MATDDTVLAAGEAGGTINGESFRIPAAWKAVIGKDRAVEWHVLRTTSRSMRPGEDGGSVWPGADRLVCESPPRNFTVAAISNPLCSRASLMALNFLQAGCTLEVDDQSLPVASA